MRDRMERLVLLPFSIGCVSESSVALGTVHHPRRSPKPPPPPLDHRSTIVNASPILRKREEDEESSSSTESMKNALKLLAFSKPNISDRFHRLLRNIKTISQLFEYKEEMEEGDMEMEIGLPTDVKHVTHIGWDESGTDNPIQGWDNLISPDLLSLHPLPLTHFDNISPTQPVAPPLPLHHRTPPNPNKVVTPPPSAAQLV